MEIIFADEKEKRAFILQMLGENCPSDLLLPEERVIVKGEPDCIACWNKALKSTEKK